MIRIKKFTTENKELTDLVFTIRKQVFVCEQKVEPRLEMDEFDDVAHHYLLYDDQKPIATARWRETENGIKLERFAVLNEYRNKGIGSVILKEVMHDTLPLGKLIYLHSQVDAVPFYESHGFKKCGKMFIEANIKHYRMDYILAPDATKQGGGIH